MKKYLFLPLTICLSIGIITSDLLNSATNLQIIFFLIVALLLLCLVKNNYQQKIYPFLIISILLGFYIHQSYNHKEKRIIEDYSKTHLLKIIRKGKITEKQISYIVKDQETNLQIILYLKNKKQLLLFPNDEIIVYGKLTEISPNLNPNQFNYKQFLSRKNIHYQLFSDNIISKHKEGSGFNYWSSKSKLFIRNKLGEFGYSTDSRAIISSMLIGDKTELSDELNQNYITTGVVHILAISGLHVMMIFMIIKYILTPLSQLKNGRKISLIISLILIWLFAFYVELKSPVFRAALMISIYYLSDLFHRPKNIYHTLSLSAFIILIFQPNNLFDVGFQLSFSAVFFIVWLNPIFREIWRIKNSFIERIKAIIITSTTAQLGTLPVSILYFNQFSGLFLFGNLILIPASFLMIIGGIISIILAILDCNITLYTWFYNLFISSINKYIKWLADFNFILQDAYISLFSALLIGIILYFIRPMILKKSKVALFIIIGSLSLIEIDRFIEFYHLNNSNELIVFNQYKKSIIGIRNGQYLSIFSEEKIDQKIYDYTIKPYKIKNRIKKINYYPYTSTFSHSHFIKHKNYIETPTFNFLFNEASSSVPSYILIHNSNIYSFKENTQVKRVIADASNYPSIISKLDFVSNSILWKTSEKGYFSIKF